jgi:hypothetical protein
MMQAPGPSNPETSPETGLCWAATVPQIEVLWPQERWS